MLIVGIGIGLVMGICATGLLVIVSLLAIGDKTL